MGLYLSKACTIKENDSKCNNIVSAATSEMQGWRKDMEDAHVLEMNSEETKKLIFFGVFDGHGGAAVSSWIARHFIETLTTSYDVVVKKFENGELENRNKKASPDVAKVAELLQEIFYSLDVQLHDTAKVAQELRVLNAVLARKKKVYLEKAGIMEAKQNYIGYPIDVRTVSDSNSDQTVSEPEFHMATVYEEELVKDGSAGKTGVQAPYDPAMSGCAAVLSAIMLEPKPTLISANAGDSRSIVSRNCNVVSMTRDHKPMQEREYKRIKAAGGFVANGRVDGNLNLSRTLGDLCYKNNKEISAAKQRITALSDITVLELCKEDEFIIHACDGIWDVLTNQGCVDLVNRYWNELTEEMTTEPDPETAKQLCLQIADKILDNCVAESPYVSEPQAGIGCDNMTIIISRLNHEFRQRLPSCGLPRRNVNDDTSPEESPAEVALLYYGTELEKEDYDKQGIVTTF